MFTRYSCGSGSIHIRRDRQWSTAKNLPGKTPLQCVIFFCTLIMYFWNVRLGRSCGCAPGVKTDGLSSATAQAWLYLMHAKTKHLMSRPCEFTGVLTVSRKSGGNAAAPSPLCNIIQLKQTSFHQSKLWAYAYQGHTRRLIDNKLIAKEFVYLNTYLHTRVQAKVSVWYFGFVTSFFWGYSGTSIMV